MCACHARDGRDLEVANNGDFQQTHGLHNCSAAGLNNLLLAIESEKSKCAGQGGCFGFFVEFVVCTLRSLGRGLYSMEERGREVTVRLGRKLASAVLLQLEIAKKYYITTVCISWLGHSSVSHVILFAFCAILTGYRPPFYGHVSSCVTSYSQAFLS